MTIRSSHVSWRQSINARAARRLKSQIIRSAKLQIGDGAAGSPQAGYRPQAVTGLVIRWRTCECLPGSRRLLKEAFLSPNRAMPEIANAGVSPAAEAISSLRGANVPNILRRFFASSFESRSDAAMKTLKPLVSPAAQRTRAVPSLAQMRVNVSCRPTLASSWNQISISLPIARLPSASFAKSINFLLRMERYELCNRRRR